MPRYGYDYGYSDWAPYVPVAQRRHKAEKKAKRRLKKGQTLSPIRITKRTIATTFWGTGWCDNLEQYSDFANRLPRGRTYARNGSIVDLQITTGKITALVAGSSPYDVQIIIRKLGGKIWYKLRKDCAESIHSLIDLMRGKLPDLVLQRLTDPSSGMFPQPKEIELSCSCPDGAVLCKHLAAVLYGVGHRLDTEPELFFQLRGVSQQDLISEAITTQSVDAALGLDQPSNIDSDELGSIFGIDLATTKKPAKKAGKRKTKKAGKKTVKKARKSTKRAKAKANPKRKRITSKKKKVAKKKKAVKKKTVKKKAAKVGLKRK